MRTAHKQRSTALPKFWRPTLADGVKLDAKLNRDDNPKGAAWLRSVLAS